MGRGTFVLYTTIVGMGQTLLHSHQITDSTYRVPIDLLIRVLFWTIKRYDFGHGTLDPHFSASRRWIWRVTLESLDLKQFWDLWSISLDLYSFWTKAPWLFQNGTHHILQILVLTTPWLKCRPVESGRTTKISTLEEMGCRQEPHSTSNVHGTIDAAAEN